MIYKTLLNIDYLIIQYPIAMSPTDPIGDIYRLSTTQDTKTDHTTADGRTWVMVYAGDWTNYSTTMRKRAKNPGGKPVKNRVACYLVGKVGMAYYGDKEVVYISGTTQGNYYNNHVNHATMTTQDWFALNWNCVPTKADLTNYDIYLPGTQPSWIANLP